MAHLAQGYDVCVLVLKKSLQFPWQFVIKEGPGGEIDAQSHLEKVL